ncbi:MAG TPA: hypothetical protein VM900_04305 [Sphingomonas sp.]|jgi:hypothetical protein|nr:hypothetical protein [Sphingomonas sp.]
MAGAKLKIYRTAIGFHDAYVAAPSQKAALEAWGSDKNLFARGAAEQVDATPLAEALIAAPGTVIKQLRGTTEEQFAALPPDVERTPPRPRAKPAAAPAPRKPRPSRAKLEKAEQAVEALAAAQREQLQELARREAELAQERRALTAAHAAERRRIEDDRDAEQQAYDRAVDRWNG